MTLSANDLGKLVELLREHPEWKEQLRAVLLSEELLRLPTMVSELVGALRQVQGTVRELAEAQARSEQRLTRLEQAVADLAEAQRRTEERVTRLEQATERLAEAQRRTDQHVAALARQVGSLANIVGTDMEEDASDVLRHVLRQKGWKLLRDPFPLSLDGEIDVAAPVEDPTGQRLWIVVEVKLRMRRKEVYRWQRRLMDPRFHRRLRQRGIEGAFLPYAFGIRVYSDALEAASEVGIGLLDTREERTMPSLRQI